MKKILVLIIISFCQTIFSQEETTVENVTIIDKKKVYNPEELEVKPEFPGEMINFYKFIAKNFSPPEEQLNFKFLFSVVVEIDGSLSNIKLDNANNSYILREATRVFKLSPKWNPGQKNGELVRSTHIIPITITGQP